MGQARSRHHLTALVSIANLLNDCQEMRARFLAATLLLPLLGLLYQQLGLRAQPCEVPATRILVTEKLLERITMAEARAARAEARLRDVAAPQLAELQPSMSSPEPAAPSTSSMGTGGQTADCVLGPLAPPGLLEAAARRVGERSRTGARRLVFTYASRPQELPMVANAAAALAELDLPHMVALPDERSCRQLHRLYGTCCGWVTMDDVAEHVGGFREHVLTPGSAFHSGVQQGFSANGGMTHELIWVQWTKWAMPIRAASAGVDHVPTNRHGCRRRPRARLEAVSGQAPPSSFLRGLWM